MALILSSLDDEGTERRIDEGATFSIGRGPDNDLVIADPSREVSKTHCRIESGHGTFTLIDLSINGVALDGQSAPLGPGARHDLKSGDVFVIAGRRFAVTLASADDTPAPGVALPPPAPRGLDQILDGASEGTESRASSGVGREADRWLKTLPQGAADETIREPMGWDAPPSTDTSVLPLDPEPPASDFANRSEHVPAANSALHLPQVRQQIPTNWFEEESAPTAPSTAVAGPASTPAPPAATNLRRALAEAARIDPTALMGLADEELMRRCGEALRAFLEGLDANEAAQGVAERDCNVSSPSAEGLWADFFATNRDPLVTLLVEPQPGPGSALAQRVAALADRQRALGNAVAESAQRYDAVLAPAAIEAETRHRLKPGPIGRAAAWVRYVGLHAELGADTPDARLPSFLLLLRKTFARAMTKRP